MAVSVVMPALEMAQETGKLVAWLKQEGEPVTKGEPLMEVETDKAVVEVEAEAVGFLAGVRAQPGDVVPVGQTIAWIVALGEHPPAVAEGAPDTRAASAAPPEVHAAAAAPPAGRLPMSPRARRLAAEAAAQAQQADAATGATLAAGVPAGALAAPEAIGTIWRVMVDRITAAWTSIPHFYVSGEIDATALVAWRSRLKARGVAASHTDLLVATASRALQQHPRLNARWADAAVQHHEGVHVGIATAVDDGLVVPVIRDANRLSVDEIAARSRELVTRARAGRLRPSDLSDGTFTISNLGMYGIDNFAAIVNPPQAAILAVGRIAERVVARDGQPVVRLTMHVTLSCDHRVVDGARAAAFLRTFAELAEQSGEAGS